MRAFESIEARSEYLDGRKAAVLSILDRLTTLTGGDMNDKELLLASGLSFAAVVAIAIEAIELAR